MNENTARVSRTEAEVLWMLQRGERFGLQLVEESGGRIKRGSVYVLLGRLEEKGLVSSRPEARPALEGGLPRRLYRITAAGAAAARAHADALLSLLRTQEEPT